MKEHERGLQPWRHCMPVGIVAVTRVSNAGDVGLYERPGFQM